MTPASTVSAAIDLLGAIADSVRPADTVVTAFLRGRRYMGSKDRAAVTSRVYGVLRHRARLTWHLAQCGVADPGPRDLALAYLVLCERVAAETVASLCDGSRYAPTPLSTGESHWLGLLAAAAPDPDGMPDAVRWELPDWAADSLVRAFGPELPREADALLQEAPLDLRVNTLVSDRDAALAALAESGLEASPTPHSPIGIRLNGRAPLSAHPAFRSGAVEIQDEGSQIVALLADARPGMQVADFCAGAGGKSLVLAARMANRGRVVAADVSAQRLDRAKGRIRRARINNVEPKLLAHERDRWVRRQKGKFDRVLIDAPCSGSGAWRRNPDARWRAVDIASFVSLQQRILESASRLAKVGGRVIYATCSLLPEENEAQIEAFLSAHPEFRPMPPAGIWEQTVGGAWFGDAPYLHLTPARSGTDGFFVAVLERTA